MPQAEYHRQRAEDCRELARSVDDRQMAAALSELADQYETCAEHFARTGDERQMLSAV